MCGPVATGMAIGAATGALGSAITGGDPLQGALMGGITGGFSGGMGGTFGLGAESWGAQFFSPTMSPAGVISGGMINQIGMGWMPAGMSAGGMLGMGITGLATSTAMGYLMPKQQDYSQYHQGVYNPIAYNTQQSQITGSGGRQAPALLAAEIKRAKKRREGQAAQGELGLATSLSNTGLQIA